MKGKTSAQCRLRVVGPACALGVALQAAPARADQHFTDHPLAIAGVVGLGTPVGFVGGEVSYSFADEFAVAAGAGTNKVGLQLALAVRLRPFVWPDRKVIHALGFGVAVSGGAWRAPNLGVGLGLDHRSPESRAFDYRYVSDRAYWLTLDVGLDLLARPGVTVRPAMGIAVMLNPGDAYCLQAQGDGPVECGPRGQRKGESPKAVVPVLGVTAGVAF